jgi:hypothetical protein
MNKSILIAFLLVFSNSVILAQKNISNYKYIIVPKQYEFQRSEDSYQINSLTKFLFERANFITYYSTDIFPEELANNSCMALKAIIKNNSSILSTKLNIDLVDCYNSVIFSTSEAKSKEKDYKKAYHAAIREAFVDIDAANYNYNATNISEAKNTPIDTKKNKVIEKVVVEEIQQKVDNTKTAKSVNLVKIEDTATPINNEIKSFATTTIEGTYLFDTWGKSQITKKDNEFLVTGGDENVELATIYSTSKPSIYIIKWRAFKQPQLVEIDTNGNLNIDSDTGKKVFKRVE